MNPVTIVVLGKYPEIFNGFRDNVNTLFPNIPKVLVRDGALIVPPTWSLWKLVQGPPVFSMPGNGNLGWQNVPANHDMLYVGDDVRFLQGNTIELLQTAAYADPSIGLLSPRVIGGVGNPLQRTESPERILYSERGLCFVCVLFKRKVIDKVGYMDPMFGGAYGYDDDDYCHRVRLAGFKLAVNPHVQVEHRHAGGTFMKARGTAGVSLSVNAGKFMKKWGFLPQ